MIRGDVDAVRKGVNAAAAGDVTMECLPMRPYEDFAKNALKVDPKVCNIGRTLTKNEMMWWTDEKFDYDGKIG